MAERPRHGGSRELGAGQRAGDELPQLALWNLNLPANSNTEVRVTINSDTTVEGGFQCLADLFTVDIVNSTGKLDFRDEASSFAK